MQDGIIKGTGNSWNLKSVPNFLTLYPTYEAFVQALIDGTLPVDLNGMNPAGWSQMGTMLNKANLLKDATAALYGLGAEAVPDEIFAYIQPILAAAKLSGDLSGKIYYGKVAVVVGAQSVPINLPRKPVFAVAVSETVNPATERDRAVRLSVSLRPDKMAVIYGGYSGSGEWRTTFRVESAVFADSSVTVNVAGNNGDQQPWIAICE